MKTLKILLIGQPNVGKSSLVNAIVGSRVTVSNYPGTTVEVAEAWKKIHDTEIRFIDTPGIYSISDKSEEEKVTEKAIFEEKVDGAIVVADATSLERSLYIALQILEAEIPFVLAINFVEDAEKKGIKIDYKKLEDLLYMPVVPINPLTRKGVNNLIEKVINIKNLTNPGFKVIYDDHIEKALEELTPYIENDG
ncbi:MAG: 50S ribosome-binding GTPase, partial [Candidatus Aminicenantes bacterium]|nr:50S ribosome-binding GTPase [Candidatus Aminicenantes bacterium]